MKSMLHNTRGPGHLQGLRGATWASAAACNVDDWMGGLDEGASYGEVRKTVDVHTHRDEQLGACAQCVGGGGR